jgi:hypothetical protein
MGTLIPGTLDVGTWVWVGELSETKPLQLERISRANAIKYPNLLLILKISFFIGFISY